MVNLMLDGVKIAELKPTGFGNLVDKTSKTTNNFNRPSFWEWIQVEMQNDVRKNIEYYLITGDFKHTNYEDIYNSKRIDYLFSQLNPEE